ncbi:hypothetical protein SKAU_G00233900 [Synaphobranchus kaupii]|uniref:Cortactin-binding protein-2 N-terminal domain-containing protein n=1 Tax=Synaphobranchus kaupii TaxID=118154 RepID=A0A9Q1F6M0_SYNKA|nr:hypothetical protein SKAU_G00233900 [Synaphobranchus kaupii]
MLEGELQARDEVITVLKAEKIDLALLEAQYGFVTPQKVSAALQRDCIQSKGSKWQEDIYEKPMAELDRLVEKQRETYRRMLEQLLLVEQAHKKALGKLEDEKRNQQRVHSEERRVHQPAGAGAREVRTGSIWSMTSHNHHPARAEKEKNCDVRRLPE